MNQNIKVLSHYVLLLATIMTAKARRTSSRSTRRYLENRTPRLNRADSRNMLMIDYNRQFSRGVGHRRNKVQGCLGERATRLERRDLRKNLVK